MKKEYSRYNRSKGRRKKKKKEKNIYSFVDKITEPPQDNSDRIIKHLEGDK